MLAGANLASCHRLDCSHLYWPTMTGPTNPKLLSNTPNLCLSQPSENTPWYLTSCPLSPELSSNQFPRGTSFQGVKTSRVDYVPEIIWLLWLLFLKPLWVWLSSDKIEALKRKATFPHSRYTEKVLWEKLGSASTWMSNANCRACMYPKPVTESMSFCSARMSWTAQMDKTQWSHWLQVGQ